VLEPLRRILASILSKVFMGTPGWVECTHKTIQPSGV
jgi:hypothetical protein